MFTYDICTTSFGDYPCLGAESTDILRSFNANYGESVENSRFAKKGVVALFGNSAPKRLRRRQKALPKSVRTTGQEL